MKKALLVLNNHKKDVGATNKFLDMLKNSPHFFDIHILYIDPDCYELHPEPGICFWMPHRELKSEIYNIRQKILDEVIQLLSESKIITPAIYVEEGKGISKDRIVNTYLQEDGPYDLVVMADNKSKFCRQNKEKWYTFKRKNACATNIVCLL